MDLIAAASCARVSFRPNRVCLVVLYSILPIHSTFCYTAPQTEVFNICDIHTIMCT